KAGGFVVRIEDIDDRYASIDVLRDLQVDIAPSIKFGLHFDDHIRRDFQAVPGEWAFRDLLVTDEPDVPSADRIGIPFHNDGGVVADHVSQIIGFGELTQVVVDVSGDLTMPRFGDMHLDN